MTAARRQLDREMTEAQLQAAVIDLAELLGWQAMHVHAMTDRSGRTRTPTSVPGWPDLFCWRPGRVLAAELKSHRGRLTAEQEAVLESLREAGIECRVWKPADWSSGAIEAVLRGRHRLADAWEHRQ